MANDQERIAALERHAQILGWVAAGLHDFLGQVLTMVASHDEIDRAILSEIKAGCIANLKREDSPAIHREAEVEREALRQFEQFADSAISKFG